MRISMFLTWVDLLLFEFEHIFEEEEKRFVFVLSYNKYFISNQSNDDNL